MKKEKGISREDIGSLIVLGFAGLLFIFMVFHLINNTPLRESMDLFCQEQGYEERTDHKTMSYRCDWDYKIECDQEWIFIVDEYKPCVERNKWGDCIKYNFTLRESEGGVC